MLGSNACSVAALGVCGPPAGSATLAAAGSLPARCATDQQPARPHRLLLLVSLACLLLLVWADVPPSRGSAICLVASPVPLPQRGVTGPILCAEPALGAPIPSRNGKGMWVMALLDPPYKAWLAVPALALGSEDLAPFPLARMVLLVPEDLPQPNLGIRCASRTQTFTVMPVESWPSHGTVRVGLVPTADGKERRCHLLTSQAGCAWCPGSES